MQNSNLKLSVVIPCYNEMNNISLLLKKLDPLPEQYPNIEILLVNNGSTDDSESIMLEEVNKRDKNVFKYVKVEKNLGYGFGILSGLEKATGDILSWTHADLQTPPGDLIVGLKRFNSGNDKIIVKGRRMGRPLFDVLFTKMMENYTNLTLHTSLNDINAQPKMFTRSFYQSELKKDPPYDFSLDLYLLWLGQKNKLQIVDFPVFFEKRLHGEAKGGGSFKVKYKLSKRSLIFINELKRKYQIS